MKIENCIALAVTWLTIASFSGLCVLVLRDVPEFLYVPLAAVLIAWSVSKTYDIWKGWA